MYEIGLTKIEGDVDTSLDPFCKMFACPSEETVTTVKYIALDPSDKLIGVRGKTETGWRNYIIQFHFLVLRLD